MISFYLTSLPLDKESENDLLLRNVYVKKRVFQFYICFLPNFGKLFFSIAKHFLTLFYMGGGTMFPPWSIIARQSSMSALNWLIFLDFVPFNIRKVLGRPFLEFFLKISKILAWTIFSDFDPKGGPFYARIKKSKKSIFFCSKSHLFSLNMNYTCSKLSFEVSDMPCNQVSSILTTFI